ncbi:C-GCAxxG-C-C family protein [Fundidesulfovibrio soli]|uniref:C-GCAxxG-C-C family protein n=1 Tax=Fundidesulfovibrio soli TaxID=2922716 RepID=UPI001FAFE0D4|nr:C-GCAxxG-C-C family protein [Fundidesulfovibrio soli]
MYCAEAIFCALNEGLGGGLQRERARGLTMGFGQGFGEAGCVCGAMSGAVLAASWFLAGSLPPAEVRRVSREIHDRFKGAHGSACCRVLIKNVKGKPKEHFAQCAGLTSAGAEIAARAILERLPELARHGGAARKSRKGTRAKAAALLRRLADRLG